MTNVNIRQRSSTGLSEMKCRTCGEVALVPMAIFSASASPAWEFMRRHQHPLIAAIDSAIGRHDEPPPGTGGHR